MAKVNRTNSELLNLVQVINILLRDDKFKQNNTKGVKKLQKIGEKIKPFLDLYNEKIEDLRLDNANVDASGSLLFNEKGEYLFSKDGLKNLNKSIKSLLNETFEFYQLTFSTEGIEEYDFLNGWVEGLDFQQVEDVSSDVIEAEVI
jgi:hypothetical protein